jgi:DNA polymerase-3 subunit alpha
MAMDLSLPDISQPDSARPVVVALPTNRCTPPLVERLKEVLTSHPGPAEVHLRLQGTGRATLLRLNPLRVAPSTALMADLKALLGPGAIG